MDIKSRKTKSFPTGAVLSAITGYQLCEGAFGQVHEIFEYMAGGPVWTHQLPRMIDEVRHVILELHPHLSPVIEEVKAVNPDNCSALLQGWKDRFGDEIAVPVMTIAEHERIDPMSELAEIVHPDKIIKIYAS